jgi:hypothetical protein
MFYQSLSDPAGTRTQGPIIKSDVLYQLSYEINLIVEQSFLLRYVFIFKNFFVIPLGLEPLALPILIGMLLPTELRDQPVPKPFGFGSAKIQSHCFHTKKTSIYYQHSFQRPFSNERLITVFKITHQFIRKTQF